MNDAFLPGNGFDTYEEQDRVLMGLSGSVRSGVAVRILQQQGFAVAAAVVRLADTPEEHAAVDAAKALAKKLDVECVTLNAEALAGQDAEAARPRALAHGAFPEADLAPLQRIGADERRRVHVDVHGNVPHRAAEQGGQILRQHVFAGGFSACQQQVFAAEQRRQRLLPHLFAVVGKGRGRDARAQCVRQGMGSAVLLDCFQQSGVYPFLLQSFKEIRHLYKHLDFAGCLAQTGCSALS